ncbi:MAG: hypothetical protein FJY10_12370, partial [Bacteroidetes bacterium]|nr:hypothetical protein [Bacteroidota bacterium]
METRILQGARIQERIFAEVRTKINDSIQESGKGPGIVFLGFEGVPLNKYSMPLHVKAAIDSGFRVASHLLPEEITFQELNNLIGKYNEDSETNAIVILQPVPGHINPILLENLIKPEKEVEGFHPQNMLGSMVPELCINPYPMCLPEALKEIFNDEGVKIRKDDEWLFVLDDGFFTNPLTQMIVRTAASKVVPKDSPVTFINKESGHLQKYLKIADFLVVVSKHP